jgi:ribosome maturation protein Sdo1
MTLQEFANRLDEVKISMLVSKAKEGKIDLEKLSSVSVGSSGIIDDKTGKRMSPEEIVSALETAGVEVSGMAKQSISNSTKDLAREAEIERNKAEVERRTQEADKKKRLMARMPLERAKELRTAWVKA